MNHGKRIRSALKRGFTLIELLLVLVILAALAAIIYPKVAGRSEDARIKAAKVQVASFKGALDAFEIDNGRYPTTDEGLRALVEQPGNCPNWKKEGYLDQLPDDPWGHQYQYRYPGTKNPRGYDVYSLGPGGQDGAVDNIGNWTEQKQ